MARKYAKRTHPSMVALNRLAAEKRLTNEEIALEIGCDRTTVWRCRKYGRQPVNRGVREALERFLANGAK